MDQKRAGAPVTKFSLSDLALKSALELEKAKLGRKFEAGVLDAFAEALSNTSRSKQEGEPVRFVRPGYHRPFVRLYRERNTADPKSLRDIQGFVADAVQRLHDIEPDQAEGPELDRLISFCNSVHRELVQGLLTEKRIALKQRRSPRAASPGVSSEAVEGVS